MPQCLTTPPHKHLRGILQRRLVGKEGRQRQGCQDGYSEAEGTDTRQFKRLEGVAVILSGA